MNESEKIELMVRERVEFKNKIAELEKENEQHKIWLNNANRDREALTEEIGKWKEVAEGWNKLCQERKELYEILQAKLSEADKPKKIKVEIIGCKASYGRASNCARQLYYNIADFIREGKYISIIDIRILVGQGDKDCALILYEELSTDATNGKNDEEKS